MNSNKTTIWAKSIKKSDGRAITLAEHTNHLLQALSLLTARSLDDRLRTLIQLSIHCHDLGKVLPAFQRRSLKNADYLPFDIVHNLPHSLVSALWIDEIELHLKISEISVNDVEDYKNFIVSAVAYHHWRENFADLIQVHDVEFRMLCEKLLEDEGFTQSLLENLRAATQEINGFDVNLVRFNSEMASGITNGVAFANYITPPYQLYWLPKRVEMPDEKAKEWILISGFLMRCDHYASFCEQEGIKVVDIDKPGCDSNVVLSRIKETIGQQDNDKIWQIERSQYCKRSSTILIAPTGFGKTEFAFLWGADEKMFYTLPLRSAVNQTFNRAQKVFSGDDGDSVGLLHSDADVYLLGDGGQSENLKLYDCARQLSHPVIVSTGDQFFPYALRPPGFEKIYATFSYSKLVIDEVQAYDPKAAAIVVKFIEDVVRMGGNFLLMTATLPEFVRERIGTSVEVVDIYQERKEQLSQLAKHKIQVKLIENKTEKNKPDFTIQEELQCVLQEAQQGQRVLVILNTVRQAQDVYKRLKDIIEGSECRDLENNIWLLHSRFTLADRRRIELQVCGDKERKLRKDPGEFENPKPADEKDGKILVATQVVEASLDLDADVLFTELAPMDALVQRMGRVVRRIRLTEDDVIVNCQTGREMGTTCEHPSANVYVWVFKNGWESGNARWVYKRELLGITLKILCMTTEERASEPKEIAEIIKTWLGANDWSAIEIGKPDASQEIQEKPKKKTGKRGKKKTEKKPDKQTLDVSGQSSPISEFDKYKFVSTLYHSLNPSGKYLDEFYKTLEILDSGYMSDRRADAQKIFREITSLAVIPENLKDDLKKDILDFYKKYNEKKRLYTFFKRDILGKYVVSIPMNAKKFESVSRYTPVHWVEEINGLSEQQRQRVAKWLRGIYFVGYKYDLHEGLKQEGTVDLRDPAFL